MHFPLNRRRLLLLSLPLTLLVLSACGSPTAAPPAAVTIDGVVTPVTGAPPVLGAALVFIGFALHLVLFVGGRSAAP